MAMRVPVVFKGVKEKMRGYASDEGGFEPSWPSRLPDPEATDIEVEGLEELPELPPPARSRSQSSTRSSAPSSTASPRNDSATEELELYISSVSPARSRRSSSCSSQGRKEKEREP
ncbi:unnamed protein product [Effrenium voratum]|uniref:Uncharacterized protein n=1 Tax=Effrenium voratum TaxID=2562239 RepID=A0AA36HX39_9DINO|nr:unnamed protein product [Effrenium voratum]